MPNHQQLIEIASAISTASEKLNDFYDEQALELRFPGGKPTKEQGQTISQALEAVLQLQRMLLGPLGSIMSLSGGLFDLASLHIIHDFEIAKLIPTKGTVTISELASTCGIIPRVHLRRILRHAMTNRIFTEPVSESVSHTVISSRLAHDPMMRATVGMLADEMFPAAACLSSAMRNYGTSLKATDTAWALANNAHRPMVEELEAEHLERAVQFAAFMKYNWSVQQPLQPLIDNFDWAALGAQHIVDVGGGMGHASIALAKAFPDLTFTVQDFEKVVKTGERMFLEETLEQPELRNRVVFMAHDAFDRQPIKGAGVYLFRSVLHDWPDENCVAMLQSLVPALKRGATVLINDFVMPSPGELDLLAERRARLVLNKIY
ncbi:S-adenosyl-L-methionine-dependent methyltransferase [Glarea lozoyensis ATCC 20868]|uniref:S-adenosyl-L-methionine-dependent methyltransferase n=1 Tax=Glarea lozoyensis (strain ATCC 20868 / MF5171) TaxID=1116229 RepID=S3D5S1_GLAL2|nr:S-adenosyl-L-methionine-dependent methyltransferase [Glarea lozoyensis ATCC 20868]EPE32484.1 S-adenosyl-L-methionine-dependent methyltransferase [Glarea lozoyensis ATCC 20868]